MPIGGHRLIDYGLAALADAGIERAVLVVGPEHEDFRRHIDSLELKRLTIDLAVQTEPLGTADAVLSAESAVDGEPFLMVNGDNYYPHRALRDLARHRGTALAGFDRAALVADSNIPRRGSPPSHWCAPVTGCWRRSWRSPHLRRSGRRAARTGVD